MSNRFQLSWAVTVLAVCFAIPSFAEERNGQNKNQTYQELRAEDASLDELISDKIEKLSNTTRKKGRPERQGAASTSQAGIRVDPQAKDTAASGKIGNRGELLPPAAEPGQCFARVWVPPQYHIYSEKVLKKEAGETIEIVPPKYGPGEEQVLVKEASIRIEVVPATFKSIEEQVLVKPASTRLVSIPAVYETVEEQVLDKPAHTIWKKGAGPIQQLDNSTGEIMCLVEVPATYKNVSRRVLKTPASTSQMEVPAVYKTVRKQVLDSPAATREVSIPAEYKTIKVMKLIESAQEKRRPIPAEYETVERRDEISGGRMEWREILCETNMTQDRMKAIQEALRDKGFDPGPVDGSVGLGTMDAVNAFQRANGLPEDKYLNIQTVKALGVDPG